MLGGRPRERHRGGCSAGGGLAVALLLRVRDGSDGLALPAAALPLLSTAAVASAVTPERQDGERVRTVSRTLDESLIPDHF